MKTLPTQTNPGPNSEDSDPDVTADTDNLGGVPIMEIDNLDETVLGAAAVGGPELVPPEGARGTEEITAWDEPADLSGTWTRRDGRDDGMFDAARLVEAGLEEADRERRLAAAGTGD